MFSTRANKLIAKLDGMDVKGLAFLGEDPETLVVQVYSDRGLQHGFHLVLPVKEIRELLECDGSYH